jgi:hypothetical protein
VGTADFVLKLGVSSETLEAKGGTGEFSDDSQISRLGFEATINHGVD